MRPRLKNTRRHLSGLRPVFVFLGQCRDGERRAVPHGGAGDLQPDAEPVRGRRRADDSGQSRPECLGDGGGAAVRGR